MRVARLAGLAWLLAAATTLAADVTGKWKAEFQGPDGQTRTNVFDFEMKGETLTGTVTSSMGGPAKIENGTVKGDDIAFTVTRNFEGNELKLQYQGTVKGDEIPITVKGNAGGQDFEFQIVAKREK
jgi:hypothetical protein